jgi:4-oxalocrotonate tautomerase
VILAQEQKPGQSEPRNSTYYASDSGKAHCRCLRFETKEKEIITKLTDAMVSIEGENMRPVTWVVIDEVRSGDWGIGGQAMTTEEVQALAAARK